MAFSTVQQAVAKVVMEAKLKVVDDVLSFLEAKIEVDDDLKAMFTEFKDSLKESETKAVKDAGKKTKGKKGSSSDDGEKKKRTASLFNLYVADIIPSLKVQHAVKDADGKDKVDGKLMIKYAAESWKTNPMALFIKDKVAELKKEKADASVHELFAEAKALYSESESEKAPTKKIEKEKVKKTSAKTKSAKKASESDEE